MRFRGKIGNTPAWAGNRQAKRVGATGHTHYIHTHTQNLKRFTISKMQRCKLMTKITDLQEWTEAHTQRRAHTFRPNSTHTYTLYLYRSRALAFSRAVKRIVEKICRESSDNNNENTTQLNSLPCRAPQLKRPSGRTLQAKRNYRTDSAEYIGIPKLLVFASGLCWARTANKKSEEASKWDWEQWNNAGEKSIPICGRPKPPFSYSPLQSCYGL